MGRNLFKELGVKPKGRNLFKEMGISRNEEQQPETLGDRFLSGVQKFNQLVEASHLPEFGAGIYQGLGDIGASLGNIIARPLGHPIPHPQLQKYFNDSLGSQIAFGAGELGSQLPLMATGAGAIGRLGLTKGAGLSGRIAEGLASGAALGENEEGGRLAGALEGAAMPAATGLAKGASMLRSKNIAKSVTEGMQKAKEAASKEFKGIFSEAENRGIKSLKPVQGNVGLLKKAGNKKFLHALDEFNASPTLENAHNAQSDLGKYIQKLKGSTDTLSRKAKEEAENIGDRLRENMVTHLNRSGSPDLGMRYANARQAYKEDVAPYLNSKSIKNLKAGTLRPSKFASKIANEESFISQMGKKHPEIEYRDKLMKALGNKYIMTGVGGLLAGLGFNKAQNLLK